MTLSLLLLYIRQILMTETHTIKLAIVEDQREIREGLAQLINATPGYRCTGVYASMEDALEKIPKNLPDVVLSDIGLPGTDGYALMRQIRAAQEEQGSRVPAIALTAFARPEDRARSLAAGYQSFLTKPVEPAELFATISSFARLIRRRSSSQHRSSPE